MTTSNFNDETRELNLAYLMLAQQMLNVDREVAMLKLGVGEDVADLLSKLSPGQILRMATADMLICQFRFDDTLLLNLLSNHDRDNQAARIHATILAAATPVGHIA
ncbi:MAG TPA: flagellar transcriptional regulator FlhD [Rhodocyclaceae bacterium]|nr:flagellar transcriptional regulator FlhD [Rhodocyclaceae bacterium]